MFGDHVTPELTWLSLSANMNWNYRRVLGVDSGILSTTQDSNDGRLLRIPELCHPVFQQANGPLTVGSRQSRELDVCPTGTRAIDGGQRHQHGRLAFTPPKFYAEFVALLKLLAEISEDSLGAVSQNNFLFDKSGDDGDREVYCDVAVNEWISDDELEEGDEGELADILLWRAIMAQFIHDEGD
ncbi:hypothetical protein ON010_g18131 [Phytophthora cinnamomi]|nr:hypothetical protein ON010_g18131 [Phytophthora cinnamomi]